MKKLERLICKYVHATNWYVLLNVVCFKLAMM